MHHVIDRQGESVNSLRVRSGYVDTAKNDIHTGLQCDPSPNCRKAIPGPK